MAAGGADHVQTVHDHFADNAEIQHLCGAVLASLAAAKSQRRKSSVGQAMFQQGMAGTSVAASSKPAAQEQKTAPASHILARFINTPKKNNRRVGNDEVLLRADGG